MANKNQMPKKASKSTPHDGARIEALFASIGEGAIATDESGNIIRINQVALDLLGMSRWL